MRAVHQELGGGYVGISVTLPFRKKTDYALSYLYR